MTKREVSRQALMAAIGEAIAVIEAQREILGESATSTALFALRQKIAAVDPNPPGNRVENAAGDESSNSSDQHELVVLAADLSGFTALAERMDAERVRDAINAMWQALDGVVEAWGGQIDQHAGDGLVALFGLPRPRRNDPARALHTALAMQAELAVFNEEAQQKRHSWAAGWPAPTMRIGVHRGPVYFGKGGYGNRRTAVGDTVNLAKALEQAAPAGGVLVSMDVVQQVQSLFELTPPDSGATSNGNPLVGSAAANEAVITRNASNPLSATTSSSEGAPGHNGQLQAYGTLLLGARQLIQEKRNGLFVPAGLIAGQETRFTGREHELDFLEQVLHVATDSGLPQQVTIAAAPGVGASRLLYEFERRLRLLPGACTVLRGQVYPAAYQPILTPWRDLVFRYSGIHLQDSPGVMREKLAYRLAGHNHQPPGREETLLADAFLSARVAGQRVTEGQPPLSLLVEAVTHFLQGIRTGSTLVLIMEQLHQADEDSLAILEMLVEQSTDLPLLVLATAQPEALSRLPGGADRAADPFTPYQRLELPPLSAIDGRHLLAEMLQRLPSPPLRLVDLIASGARGNPLFMEEMVKLLLNNGGIVGDSGNGRWRVDMAQVETTRLPSSLEELLRARLAQLSPMEQRVVERAAVMGPIFWDTALQQEDREVSEGRPNETMDNSSVDSALFLLEKKRLIMTNQAWSFTDAQAYLFVHPLLRDVAYHELPLPKRQALHQQFARWLMASRQNGRVGNGLALPPAGLITYHLQQAGEDVRLP